MEDAGGMGSNPIISFPAGRCSLPRQYTTKLRENSLQMFSYQLSNLHTHPILSVNAESEKWDGWMGQEEIPAWRDVRSCYLQAVQSAAVLRAAWRWSIPKTQAISKSPSCAWVGYFQLQAHCGSSILLATQYTEMLIGCLKRHFSCELLSFLVESTPAYP